MAKAKPGKRHPLNVRTTKELRDQVEAAARLSGRSLVQEVEHRLERSFQEDRVIGDAAAAAAYHALASRIAIMRARHGENWRESANIGRELVGALVHAITQVVPNLQRLGITFADQSYEMPESQIRQERTAALLSEVQKMREVEK